MNTICSEIDRLARTYLDLKRFGFKESARVGDSDFPWVIYDSEWCRLRIEFDGWEPPNQLIEYSLRISYARLHAPSENHVMLWRGEECNCWHHSGEVLNFLDGLSSLDASSQKGFPRFVEEWRKTHLWRKLVEKRRLPELEIRMEAAIWKHYGMRLFELLDLRRPDLWEEYRKFLKEYYDIKGRSPNIKPPLDQVC